MPPHTFSNLFYGCPLANHIMLPNFSFCIHKIQTMIVIVKHLPPFGEDYIRHLASLVAQMVKNLSAMWETWVPFLVWEDSLEKGKAAYSSILA